MPMLRAAERDERLVLDGAAQRRERLLVAEVVGLQAPVHAEHEVGAALVVAEGLHEQLPAVDGLPEVRRGAASVDARRFEPAQRHVHPGEPGGDRSAGRAPGRRAQHDEDGGPGEPSRHRRGDGVEVDGRRAGTG